MTRSRLALVLASCLASSCAGSDPVPAPAAPAAIGAGLWSSRATSSRGDCGEDGPTGPFAHARFNVQALEGGPVLNFLPGGESVPWRAPRPGLWQREVSFEASGCRVSAAGSLEFVRVLPTRFTAVYRADYRALAGTCPWQRCTLTQEIDGARP